MKNIIPTQILTDSNDKPIQPQLDAFIAKKGFGYIRLVESRVVENRYINSLVT